MTYQKCLDDMCRKCGNYENCISKNCISKKKLQKLIDKSKLQRVLNMTDHSNIWEPGLLIAQCPVCGEDVYSDEINCMTHCRNCGQLLGWYGKDN